MKYNEVKSLIFSASIGLMLLTGIGVTTAREQHWTVHRTDPVEIYNPYQVETPYWGRPYRGSPAAVDVSKAHHGKSGYEDGYKRGKADAMHGHYAPTSQKDYSKSDSPAYRQTFLLGYDDGYHEKMTENHGG